VAGNRWGGIALSYTGNVLEVWAQITFHGIGGGSIDETFNILEEPGSDTREAVWLTPAKKAPPSLRWAIARQQRFTPSRNSAAELVKTFEIPAGVTRFIRHRAREGRDVSATPESVKLTTVGPKAL